MKPIKELQCKRGRWNCVSSRIMDFSKYAIDFDVFLPSLGINLQRHKVWELYQKRELIWSMLLGRDISPFSMVQLENDTYQVIDGKQRLSTMLDFYNNCFELEIEGKNYFFKDLPIDYQNEVQRFHFRYYIAFEFPDKIITDQYKIDWFISINFAGTPHDLAHFDNLKNNNK